MLTLSNIEKPKIDIALYGTDSNIPAIDKVHMMDEDSFELFTQEWLYGSKRTQYVSISRIGGAGDKGRDIIAKCATGEVDYYQCKHYNAPLMPSEYYQELGKLCYYTYTNEIAMPRRYYIVASHDIGPALEGLLADHKELKKALITNWGNYCEKKITKANDVKLEGPFLAYVNGFDFSIVEHYPIAKVIDEHLQTIYGNIRFGGQRLQRPEELEPSQEVDTDELAYIAALLEAYSDELKINIDTVKALEAYENYASDLERLSFIVDGEANITKEKISHCPFCDGAVVVQRKQGYIDAAKAEYSKIIAQSKDLEDAYTALLLEKTTIEQRISDLLASKNAIEAVINETLKPELASLKDSLAQYKYVVELESEIAFIQRFVDNKAADILKVDTTDDYDGELFDPKEYLDYDMVTKFCEMLHQILEECKYPNLTSVTFERNTMDIAVNGKRKRSNGKGYAAYLNTAVVIGFAKYLKKYAEYAPGLVVADSPILSLKEKDNQRASESMRAGLFEYITNNTEGIQVIVAENEIPNIDYKAARIIRFTKEPHNGRYGFLADVVE